MHFSKILRLFLQSLYS